MASVVSIPRRLLEHQQLRPLLALVRRDGTAESAFFRAYFRSKLSYGTRSLALRLVLEDHRSWDKGCGLPNLTPALLRNIVAYLEAHPRTPLRPFEGYCGTHDLPSHLGRMFGRWPMWGNELVRRAVVQPYFRALAGQEPFPDVAGNVTSREALAILAAVAQHAVLTRTDANRLLTEPYTTHVADFFFATGVPTLDARNALLFAEELLARHGETRALKSKIPRALSRRLGIRRVCLPDLMLAADILALAVLDALPSRQPASPLQRIVEVIARPSKAELTALPDLRALARGAMRRSLLDDSDCRALRESLEAGTRWHHLYQTGFVFNLERLISGRRTQGGFERFAPFYDGVSIARMQERVLAHYRQVDPAFADALEIAVRKVPGEFRGIGMRSLANSLFCTRWLAANGEEPRVVLPVVAQFRLGRYESISGGRRSRKRKKRRHARRPPQQRVIRPLPLLDELVDRVPDLVT